MPSELLLIILWQCLEGLNKIRAISASAVQAEWLHVRQAPTQYFWARHMSPFCTLARSKFVRKPLPTAAALGSVERRVCGIAWPGQDPKV